MRNDPAKMGWFGIGTSFAKTLHGGVGPIMKRNNLFSGILKVTGAISLVFGLIVIANNAAEAQYRG